MRHFNAPKFAPPVDQNGVDFHDGGECVFAFVENLDGESDVAILAERVEQDADVFGRRFGL